MKEEVQQRYATLLGETARDGISGVPGFGGERTSTTMAE
jgi:hypothetical protein